MPAKKPRDLYRTLGLERDATEDQVKAAYRKLAFKLHPDRNPGDEKASFRFKRVQTAYEVLSDPGRRARYDKTGEVGAKAVDADLNSVLAEALTAVLAGMVENRKDPKRSDVPEYLKNYLKARVEVIEKGLEDLKRARKVTAEVMARLQVAEGEDNPLVEMARRELAQFDRGEAKAKELLDLYARAVAYIPRYTYRKDGGPTTPQWTTVSFEWRPL